MRATMYMAAYKTAAVLLACFVIASPAFAFKEVPVEGVKSAPMTPAAGASKSSDAPRLSLSGNEDGLGSAKKGTELRIPGIGSLGTLPKLDFGLELLYGATDQELPQNELDRIDPEEDMTIRGTLKHNF